MPISIASAEVLEEALSTAQQAAVVSAGAAVRADDNDDNELERQGTQPCHRNTKMQNPVAIKKQSNIIDPPNTNRV